MDRSEISERVRRARALCRQADELGISLIRHPDATLDDVKLMRESLLRLDEQVDRVDKALHARNVQSGGRPLTIRGAKK